MITRRKLLAGGLGILAASIIKSVYGAETMRWADMSRGYPKSKDPSVIRFHDKYLMYFSMPPRTGDTRWSQGVAQSTDLVNWKTVAELPLFDKGICAGDAIVLDGKVHLFYQAYSNGTKDTICHATSDDGIHFDRTIDTPIFRPTGSWNCGRAIDAEARVIGDELLMYWATRDPTYKFQMLGVHSAPVWSDFTAKCWQQRCTDPILRPQLAWEGQCIEAPSIQKSGSTYVMFYAGNYNAKPQQIGVAFSKDGLKWTRMSDKPFLRNGLAGSWNEDESGHPGIFWDATTRKTWLFYQGSNDGGMTYFISKRQILWDGHVPRLP
jgi:predicted GH43/DUF377 family glycosyl hydrolase